MADKDKDKDKDKDYYRSGEPSSNRSRHKQLIAAYRDQDKKANTSDKEWKDWQEALKRVVASHQGPGDGSWGTTTLSRKLKALDRRLVDQEKELDEADKHVQTVKEIKIVLKWLKAFALGVTTIAGAYLALKHTGVL